MRWLVENLFILGNNQGLCSKQEVCWCRMSIFGLGLVRLCWRILISGWCKEECEWGWFWMIWWRLNLAKTEAAEAGSKNKRKFSIIWNEHDEKTLKIPKISDFALILAVERFIQFSKPHEIVWNPIQFDLRHFLSILRTSSEKLYVTIQSSIWLSQLLDKSEVWKLTDLPDRPKRKWSQKSTTVCSPTSMHSQTQFIHRVFPQIYFILQLGPMITFNSNVSMQLSLLS
jgi:hypothetical protein